MSGLRVYYDLMSQPSRAVLLFLKACSIPFVEKPLALRKGEHLTEQFGRINPFKKVPVIDDDGFILSESVAILRYLAAKHSVADHWYPSDIKQRARVDEYMAWQHANTRLNAAAIYRLQVIEPKFMHKPVDQEKVSFYKTELEKTLSFIENVYLKEKEYLCGEEISIADILGVCELMQPLGAGQDVREGWPKLAAWMDRVKERLQPHFDEVHQIVYKARDNYMENQS